MGAGQIGGIATLLDIDFENAEGFLGVKANLYEGQYMTYFMSHTMLFCAGALIESSMVMTPASCVYGEKYTFEIFAGTHLFVEDVGARRKVRDMCLYKMSNSTYATCRMAEFCRCSHENIALLVLSEPLSFQYREPKASFVVSRLRYGFMDPEMRTKMYDQGIQCHMYGWGSRRNGFLVPLLLHAHRMELTIMDPANCEGMFPYADTRYLCVLQPPCRSKKYGALCPDDVGSVIECGGIAVGMQASRNIDRPCGIGFLDLSHFLKFLTCSVDDANEVIRSNFLTEISHIPFEDESIEKHFAHVATHHLTTEHDAIEIIETHKIVGGDSDSDAA